MTWEEARAAIHEAVQAAVEEHEIAVSWCLTIDVAGRDGGRYLAHRAGGGGDGSDPPMAWAALGMLEASCDVARRQLADWTEPTGDDE